MIDLNLPAFYLGVSEELQKTADLQTKIPGETPEQLLSRFRQNKVNFPQFMQNAQQHSWNIPGVPFSGSLVRGFLDKNTNNPAAVQEKIKTAPDDTLLKIINKNQDAFKGVQNQPLPSPVQPEVKLAVDLEGMPVNENILPTLSNQAKWKYVRTKDGLRLSDGNLVYSFGGLPEEYPAEDSKVSRLADDNILNFENDALNKGTAQIHRSSPDNIYMTLANGSHNPTFMLQHEGGQNWRYSPAKKFAQKLKAMKESLGNQQTENIHVDPAALVDAASDEGQKIASYDSNSLANLMVNAKNTASGYLNDYVNENAEHPLRSFIGHYIAARGVHHIIDELHPERAEEIRRDPAKLQNRRIRSLVESSVPVLASLAYKAQ